jgi:hypothetical protein
MGQCTLSSHNSISTLPTASPPMEKESHTRGLMLCLPVEPSALRPTHTRNTATLLKGEGEGEGEGEGGG